MTNKHFGFFLSYFFKTFFFTNFFRFFSKVEFLQKNCDFFLLICDLYLFVYDDANVDAAAADDSESQS